MSTKKFQVSSDRGDITGTEFYGGESEGPMIQLTQGTGGLDTPGYIQLTRGQAMTLAKYLNLWTTVLN